MAAEDIPSIVAFVERERIDLTVVGPEATLVAQDADGDHLVRCLRPEAMVPAANPAHVVESALPAHSRS